MLLKPRGAEHLKTEFWHQSQFSLKKLKTSRNNLHEVLRKPAGSLGRQERNKTKQNC